MQREYTVIWHWNDGGGPSAYPVMARNRLEAYLRAVRTTDVEARGGLRAIDILHEARWGEPSRTRVYVRAGRATQVERRCWS